MRTPDDALRSVKRYVSEILGPQPVLSELVSSDAQRWTMLGRVDGAVNVERSAFSWLRSRDRMPSVAVGAPDDPEIYYLRSSLTETVAELEAAAALEEVDLRVGEPENIGWRLPLQPPWEVRLAYDQGEVPQDRPFARVALVGAAGTSGSALQYEVRQAMAIECLPQTPENADEAIILASQVMGVLLRGFRGPGVGMGRPIRVPLYDYEGVGVFEPATSRHYTDFLRVQDFSVRQLPDPNDPLRVGVVADVRMSWHLYVDPLEIGWEGTRITDELRLSGEGDLAFPPTP